MSRRLTVFSNYRIKAGPIIRSARFLHNLPVEASVCASEVVHIAQGCLQLRFIYLCKPAKFIIRPSKGVRLIKSRISLEVIYRSYLFIEKPVIPSDRLIGIEHAGVQRCANRLRLAIVWASANQPARQSFDYVLALSCLAPSLFVGASNYLMRQFIDSDRSCIRLLQV